MLFILLKLFIQYLNKFFEQLGMLLTPFSFIWIFQIVIGYSKFLRNAHSRIFLFSIVYFRRC